MWTVFDMMDLSSIIDDVILTILRVRVTVAHRVVRYAAVAVVAGLNTIVCITDTVWSGIVVTIFRVGAVLICYGS